MGERTGADSGTENVSTVNPHSTTSCKGLRERGECVQVAQAYLEHLLKEGRFEEAAKLCPRLLKVGPEIHAADAMKQTRRDG